MWCMGRPQTTPPLIHTTPLPAVDLSAMPGGATPLLDDAFMQEVSEARGCVAVGGFGGAQGRPYPAAKQPWEAPNCGAGTGTHTAT